MSDETTELQSLSKLKRAGKLRYWRGTIEIPETELHAICDEIQAEHDRAKAATLWRKRIAELEVENERLCNAGYEIGYHDAMKAAKRGGTLTAEQVREAIERNFGKVAVLDDGKPVEWRDDWVCKVGINYKAIADELNATLGSGTCEPKWTLQGKTQTQEFWRCECGNCGYEFGVEDRQSSPWHVVVGSVDVPNFCPECGAKQEVVER